MITLLQSIFLVFSKQLMKGFYWKSNFKFQSYDSQHSFQFVYFLSFQCNISIYYNFQSMNCFEYDNPAFKIKILDYTYSSQPSINNALPLKRSKIKIALFILGVILSFGFIWLLSKWSAKRKAIFTTMICSLEEATLFLIHDQDTEGETTLVEKQNKYQIRIKRNCPAFNYHDRSYIYIEEKQVFIPVRYEELGLHLDKLKKDKFYPITQAKRNQLLDYYGPNVISIKVLNLVQIFIQQMLTPFQVFQTYGIILWIYEQYYLFSIILMSYSVYTYGKNAKKIKQNQQKLAFQSYYDVQTKVLVNENQKYQQEDQQRQQVQLCKIQLKIDEHKSQIMKNNFKGIQDIQKDLQMTVKRDEKKYSKEVKNEENSLINNKNVRFQSISSHRLVPGDIILLNELDVVPCDCILLRGQALVDESFSTGENYLVRKEEIQNFTYVKQDQKSFNLYLGTVIKKIKNNQFKLKKKNNQSQLQSLIQPKSSKDYGEVNELVCLVTNTNFNTLRGKFLRAIRYQTKQESNFFKQTIYFIYILIVITTLFYFGYLNIIGPYTPGFSMFIIYIDLIFVAIPPTLPTILMLGTQFVLIRLQKNGINCVFPKSSLMGGKVNTIILKGQQVFGKQYQIQSAAIGTKGQRGFGLTFTTINQFQSYADDPNISYRDLEELQLKKKQRSQFHKMGTYFINALSSCHTLQFFQHQIQGSVIQKKIFQFSQARNLSQDQFETLNFKVSVHKIIRFKEQSMKLAVVATLKQKCDLLESPQRRRFNQFEEINQNNITKKNSYGMDESEIRQKIEEEQGKSTKNKRVIILRGPAEKILQSCFRHTYPVDAFEYIVDMAEKGFLLLCYAMKEIDIELKQNFDYHEYISKSEFTFLGFLIMQQLKTQENLQAIKALNQSDVKIIYVSEQRELQATSKAISNGICDKNQLILCNISRNRDKVYCKGHIQWQSSTSQGISQFLTDFQQFGKNSKVSLSAPLYTELYMKREHYVTDHLFQKTLIYNKMDLRCQKNLYTQLQKRNRVSCAVGCSADLSQSSILSIELQREKSALLSNFYSKSNSLKTIVNCLRICRAGLSTNFHGFSMVVLFTLTQFTSVVIMNYNYQQLNDDQMLFDDLFVTFPIFITINLTQPASKLSKQLPPNSFFSLRNMVSMIGQLIIQFFAQLGFVLFVFSMDHFKNQRQQNFSYYLSNAEFRQGSAVAQGVFILTNYLYLGIVLSTSVSKPFRKPFYTNPFYTLNLILVWCLNTLLVVFSSLSFSKLRSQDSSEQAEFVRVLALVVGNLMMIVMYLYENLLFFIWKTRGKCFQKKQVEQIIIMKQGRQILN